MCTPANKTLAKDVSIGEQLNWLAENKPEHRVAVFTEEGITYTCKKLKEKVDEVAKAMISIGITRDTHVGIIGCNSSKWVLVFLACAKIGAISVPVNANLKHIELEHILSQSDISFIFMNKAFQKNDLLNEVSLIPEIQSLVENIILFDQAETQTLNGSFLLWNDFILKPQHSGESKLKELSENVDSSHMFCIHYASGTARLPVGIMLRQFSVLNSAFRTGEALHASEEDALCVVVPFFHCFGSIACILSTLMCGNTMVVVDSYNPKKALKAIQEYKCTIFFGVPAMYTMMMNYEHFSDYDITSLYKGIISGSKFPEALAAKITEVMGMNCLINGWGLTEASAACTLPDIYDPYEKRILTAGRPSPNVLMKIVDDSGKELPPGSSGEMCVKGSCVMDGYYKNEEETQKVIDKDGWLHTGDIGFVDGEGYYTVIDRKKDIIIRGGQNISPSEVEAEICTYPGVIEAQVVGAPDEVFGEVVAACVIAKDNVTDEDLKKHVNANMDEHKVPKYIFCVDNFIRTGSGKIQKVHIRKMVAEWVENNSISYDKRKVTA